MPKSKTIATALFMSAVLFYLPADVVYAQVPVIDASSDYRAPAKKAAPEAQAENNSVASELYYQLQLLQQEVMALRGIVEQQSHELSQMKELAQQRYIEMDGRIADLSTQGVSPAQGSSSAPMMAEQPGEKAAYDQAYQLVREKRFSEALAAFKTFLVNYPDGDYAANSYYWMGEIYLVVEPADLDASRQSFSQLLNQFPNHSKAADAMYKLGKVYYLKGDKVKAREWLDKVVANYSNGSNAAAAQRARQFIKDNF